MGCGLIQMIHTRVSPFSLVRLGGSPARMACCSRSESPCLAALYMPVARAMASGGREDSEDGPPVPAPELLLIIRALGGRSKAPKDGKYGCVVL